MRSTKKRRIPQQEAKRNREREARRTAVLARQKPLDDPSRKLAQRIGVRITVISPVQWLIHNSKTGRMLGTWNPKTGYYSLFGVRHSNCRNFDDVAELLKVRCPKELRPRAFTTPPTASESSPATGSTSTVPDRVPSCPLNWPEG